MNLYIDFFAAEKCINKVNEAYKKARRRFFLGVRVIIFLIENAHFTTITVWFRFGAVTGYTILPVDICASR